MAGPLNIDGTWPSPVSITRNWARAHARPWNDETPDAFLRLDRGGVAFLSETSDHLVDLCGHGVYSPAVFGSSARIWEKSGYRPVFELDMMERSLDMAAPDPRSSITESDSPDWADLFSIDLAAFEGFWRMSEAGLREAAGTATTSSTLTIVDGARTIGFAVVGIQWGVSYLQRIAVHPNHVGSGLGTDLVRASIIWARRTSAPVMVLNVRPGNSKAIALYEKEGFTKASLSLQILRYAG